eukprot:NODE_706_length_804_cov_838.152318_g536_i0.p1 GENE.NODE_706_length_804_cov_838.152318_g536_i0~~NODE_706_length_804_cov_838.152318_g536_i0.p1  ORF type:complete len:226 (+),score=43.38 NODE_706_length_804_cov_838.152318_g536_i0:25-678(+)
MGDAFASKSAAREEESADAAITNVTGSNSVNVFLGLGLPYVIGSCYYVAQGEDYNMPSGSLGFSVLLYLITAVTCIGTLIIKRTCACMGTTERYCNITITKDNGSMGFVFDGNWKITSIDPNGPAVKSGMAHGDDVTSEIIQIGDNKVEHLDAVAGDSLFDAEDEWDVRVHERYDPPRRGELGGKGKNVIAAFFVFLWMIYIVFSSLEVYGHISRPF